MESSQGPSEKRPRADNHDNRSSHRVETWRQEGSYPKGYFESGDKTWEDIKADTSKRFGIIGMAHPPLARTKSVASLRRQALEAITDTSTQETEGKSAVYKDSSYGQFLKEQGIFLDDFHQGIEENSKNECQNLLNTEQTVPKDSDTLFHDDVFQSTCAKLRGRNEARVINDIARLIVPSAETLATYGAINLKELIVGMNERWNESIPLTPTAARPQPDFCVGFQRSAFTKEQLKKLEPFTGNIFARTKLSSFFLATWQINFPFLTCEVKCGLGALDIADRQNANSMTLSVRGLVELFRFVKREKEIHRKILAFSISHDDKTARIYGHYPIIDGDKTSFYRHSIKNFVFTSEEGKEKWTAYKFTKNVYNTFMPKHHKLICSAIDDIPANLNLNVSSASLCSNTPIDTEAESNSQDPDSQEIATSAPGSQNTTGTKRKRLTGNVVLQRQLDQRDEQVDWLIQEMKELRQSARQENERQRQELKEEIERQRQESKEEIDELKEMLKQLVAASSQKGGKK